MRNNKAEIKINHLIERQALSKRLAHTTIAEQEIKRKERDEAKIAEARRKQTEKEKEGFFIEIRPGLQIWRPKGTDKAAAAKVYRDKNK
jgi:hypothetical protein